MASDLAAVKQHLWLEIDRRRDEVARLCADGLRLPAENPPGDTRAIADYYATLLGHAGLPVERFGLPSDVGRLSLGGRADFVIWDGDPLDPAAKPVAVVVRGQRVGRGS